MIISTYADESIIKTISNNIVAGPHSTYFINYYNMPSYMKDNMLYPVNSVNNLTLDDFQKYGMKHQEFNNSFLNKNILSLYVSSLDDSLQYQLLMTDATIINKDYIFLNMGAVIHKMKINEISNECIAKYIFCVDEKWYWFNNNIWNLIELSDFNIENGNTSTQINLFTENNWLEFDKLFISSKALFQRKIKICVLLVYNSFGQTPKIKDINIWCSQPIEATKISTNKYTIIDYYDKHEIIWNDASKTSLIIFYE